MPANTHTHVYVHIFVYIFSHIYTYLYTYIWLHIHNLTSNQCTCTHWLYIPAWLLCLLRAVFWPGTSGSYVLSILGASSVCDSDYIWLALWLATCCWWTKSGKQCGRFSHQNFIPSTVLSHIYIYTYIIYTYSKSPVSILDTHQSLLRRCPLTPPGRRRLSAASLPQARRQKRFGCVGVSDFQLRGFEQRVSPKKRINWFGLKSLGSYFWILFSDLQLKSQKTVNPQRKIVVMEYHRIHFNFFEVFVRWVYMLHFATWFFLTNVVYAMAMRGRRLADPSLSLGRMSYVAVTLCRSVLSNRGDFLGIFEGFLKKA